MHRGAQTTHKTKVQNKLWFSQGGRPLKDGLFALFSFPFALVEDKFLIGHRQMGSVLQPEVSAGFNPLSINPCSVPGIHVGNKNPFLGLFKFHMHFSDGWIIQAVIHLAG